MRQADKPVVNANTGWSETGRQARYILDALQPGDPNRLRTTLDRVDAALGAQGIDGRDCGAFDTRQAETVELLEAIVQTMRQSLECPPACVDLLRHLTNVRPQAGRSS